MTDKSTRDASPPLRPEQLLRDAAKLIETALVLLDTSATQCGECSQKHYTNWNQASVYKALTDTPHKLRAHADVAAGLKSPSRK